MTQIKRFNLRVYAIISNDQGEILISKERRGGFEFTKFPGGGVELGEGILDALIRELREELGAEIDTAEFFYTNDFFQASAFRPEDQIVSFYYRVSLKDVSVITMERKVPLGSLDHNDFEYAVWLKKSRLIIKELTFPMDQDVLLKFLET